MARILRLPKGQTHTKGRPERRCVGPRQLSPPLLCLPSVCSHPQTISWELVFTRHKRAMHVRAHTCTHTQFKDLTHTLYLFLMFVSQIDIVVSLYNSIALTDYNTFINLSDFKSPGIEGLSPRQ